MRHQKSPERRNLAFHRAQPWPLELGIGSEIGDSLSFGVCGARSAAGPAPDTSRASRCPRMMMGEP